MVTIERGDIFYADLGVAEGREQGGVRPVIIIQNDKGNKHSPTVIVAAITSSNKKMYIPTHTEIKEGYCRASTILLEQIRTLDKTKLKERVCHLDADVLEPMNTALMVSLGLVSMEY